MQAVKVSLATRAAGVPVELVYAELDRARAQLRAELAARLGSDDGQWRNALGLLCLPIAQVRAAARPLLIGGLVVTVVHIGGATAVTLHAILRPRQSKAVVDKQLFTLSRHDPLYCNT